MDERTSIETEVIVWKTAAGILFGGLVSLGASQMMHVRDEVNKDQVQAIVVLNDKPIERELNILSRKVDSLHMTMEEAVFLLRRSPELRLSHKLNKKQ
jgi:hypothetical protein